MKIFIHTDLDGKACGAILMRKFPKATIINYNYFYKPDKNIMMVEHGEPVIFADITPTPENRELLMTRTNDITIIDHHSSSLRDLERANLKFPGIQTEDGLGACALTWEYYCKDHPVPRGIKWIAEYDAWVRTIENKRFVFGLSKFFTMPPSNIWDKIFTDDDIIINRILEFGSQYLSYLVPWYKRLIKSYAIPGFIDDISGSPNRRFTSILINQAAVDSSIFDDLEKKYDIYLRVVYGKNCVWLVSATTDRDDIDLTELAVRFNGGGHKRSVGFAVDDLHEFFIPEIVEDPKVEKKET